MRRAAHRCAEAVAGAMLVAVFVIYDFNIVMRYAFDRPPAWAEELTAILFVWIIFWANALLVPDAVQIRFDLIVQMLPAPARRACAVLRNLVVGGLFAAGAPAAIGYIAFLRRQATPVLGWRLDAVYACFGLFMVAVVVRAALALFRLAGRGWADAA